MRGSACFRRGRWGIGVVYGLRELVHQKLLINFYPEESQELDKVLNIFTG